VYKPFGFPLVKPIYFVSEERGTLLLTFLHIGVIVTTVDGVFTCVNIVRLFCRAFQTAELISVFFCRKILFGNTV